jgi:hypothetical protein
MRRKAHCKTTIILLATIIYTIGGVLFKSPSNSPMLLVEHAAQAANYTPHYPKHLSTEWLCNHSHLICVADVIKADLGRKAWSGYCMFTSAVEYKVVKVLKGTYDKSTLIINEIIVSPNSRVTKEASLSPQLFTPGTKLLLCLLYDPQTKAYRDDQNDKSVQPYTEELEQKFVNVLSNKSQQTGPKQ